MTPEEIRKKRMAELGPHRTELPPALLELIGTDPALADEFLQRIGMAEKQGPSLMGQAPGPTTTMEGMGPEPAPRPDETTIEDVDVSAGGQAPATKTGGGAGWTNAATLALANSMPELIKAAYQRPDRPQGRSVGGGKPAFQMADPFGKRERFRSMMASYLR